MKWPQDIIGQLSLLSLVFTQCCRRQLAEACRPCSLECIAHATAPQQDPFLPCAMCACVSTCRCLMFRRPTIQQRLYITRKTKTVLCKWLEENVSVGTGHRARPQWWPAWTDTCIASVLTSPPPLCLAPQCQRQHQMLFHAPHFWFLFLEFLAGSACVYIVGCVSSNWLPLSYVYGSGEWSWQKKTRW